MLFDIVSGGNRISYHLNGTLAILEL